MKQNKRLAAFTGAASAMARSHSRKISTSSSVKVDRSREVDQLIHQLALYAVYHGNRWNWWTHAQGVTVVFWSVLVWSTYFTSKPVENFSGNASLVVVAAYATYYASFDVSISVSWLLGMGAPLWIAATAFRVVLSSAWIWAMALHVIGWCMQIHVWQEWSEFRRPFFIDAIFPSIMLAPLVVGYDLLFILRFCQTTKTRVDNRIREITRS